MDIAIVGSGYVGLVTGACLAKVGHRVVCIDKDTKKIEALQTGRVPFYEPGLDDLVAEQSKAGRLVFSTDTRNAAGARFVFLAVGTPSDPDGRADLKNLMDSARELAAHLSAETIVVVKSTVPVGTCEHIQEVLTSHAALNGAAVRVASNPEFLAEGRAIQDCLEPERIVIGSSDPEVQTALRSLYAAFDPTGERTLVMDVRSAELAKYACNAMLASRISMVNELCCLAGQLEADIEAVCQVMRTDPRIGAHYLQPGVGYGGSCLPKDVKALMALARDHNEPAHMLNSIETVNERQSQLLLQAIAASLGDDLHTSCIAVWGLSFKPGTDDIRSAPSLRLIRGLLQAGARVQACDPVAVSAAEQVLTHSQLKLTHDPYAACEGADALVVMTEWEQFREPDFGRLRASLRHGLVFDGRLMYDSAVLRTHGLTHYRVGQLPVLSVDAGLDPQRSCV